MSSSTNDFNALGFRADYHAAPGTGEGPQVIDFSRTRQYGAGPLTLETTPSSNSYEITPLDGESWCGRFECGPGGLTGLYATPSPRVLCVLSDGNGFWIPVQNPRAFDLISVVPVKEVFAVPERGLLVFVNCTRLAAYDAGGLIWHTNDVSWDGIEICEIGPDCIRGKGWDSPGDSFVSFCVDLASGETSGGSSPNEYRSR